MTRDDVEKRIAEIDSLQSMDKHAVYERENLLMWLSAPPRIAELIEKHLTALRQRDAH
jgi:hypothetical protein